MAEEINVVVIAKALEPESALDSDDTCVAGTYDVYLDTKTPNNRLQAAALDAFHTSVAVACLDHFTFTVQDTDGNEITDDVESESYSLAEHCISVEGRND